MHGDEEACQCLATECWSWCDGDRVPHANKVAPFQHPKCGSPISFEAYV